MFQTYRFLWFSWIALFFIPDDALIFAHCQNRLILLGKGRDAPVFITDQLSPFVFLAYLNDWRAGIQAVI